MDCEPSWQSFQSNCYRLVGEKKSWQDAKKTCLRSGGDLVSIHTLSELEFVTKQVKQGEGSPSSLWVRGVFGEIVASCSCLLLCRVRSCGFWCRGVIWESQIWSL